MADEKEQNEPNLMFERKFAFDVWDDETTAKAFDFCEGYKDFLSKAKTERLAVKLAEDKAVKNGFKRLEHIGDIEQKGFTVPVYSINRNKAIILAKPGKKPVSEGVRMVLAHIDSPRLDLKMKPLFEGEHIAFLKTHYYGGIKKYQWTALPLAMHGVIVKSDGTKIDIAIGDDLSDPIFMITDLLPHLSKQQYEKKLDEAISAESLNIVIGSLGTKDKEDKEPVKKNILKQLNRKYGISEEDFLSADLELVPQGLARDLGFDASMIAAYGHDDRVCAYAAFESLFASENNEYATIAVLTDKEEIGSESATSASSSYIMDFISELIFLENGKHNENILRDSFSKSRAISADVTVGFDPDYADVFDSANTARIGAGIAVEKVTGHRGKYSASEADAEYLASIRKVMNDAKIIWQTGGMGKVDIGGGGTVAMYLARLNMDIVDIGVPLLSMHAPFEIASKADIYSAYLAYKAFFEAK